LGDGRHRQRARQISNRFAAIIKAGFAHLDKSKRDMESVRFRVRRILVDLAENQRVSGPGRMFKKILIELARVATPARGRRDDDSVDIDEARIAATKPLEIRAVVRGILIERKQEGIEVSDSSRQEGVADEMDCSSPSVTWPIPRLNSLCAQKKCPGPVPGQAEDKFPRVANPC
jgi:hypothetical protein